MQSKPKDHNLPLDCKLKLFYSIVLPILLYGCEIWGYENIDIIENVHINVMRRILPFKKNYNNKTLLYKKTLVEL